MDQVEILGHRVHIVTMQETMDTISQFILEETPHLVITLGTEMIMYGQNDPEFRRIVNDADLVTPDTIGVLWASKRKKKPIKEKVPGVDILERAAATSAKFGWKIFLLGGAPGVAEEAAGNLLKKYPGANFVGTEHGFFKSDKEVVSTIAEHAPDILFIALGSPKQEKWFIKNKHFLKAKVWIGVGGSFDVHAGKAKRAPRWMIRLGLEWFYRLIQEPKRIGRMMALPAFALKVILQDKNPPG